MDTRDVINLLVPHGKRVLQTGIHMHAAHRAQELLVSVSPKTPDGLPSEMRNFDALDYRERVRPICERLNAMYIDCLLIGIIYISTPSG